MDPGGNHPDLLKSILWGLLKFFDKPAGVGNCTKLNFRTRRPCLESNDAVQVLVWQVIWKILFVAGIRIQDVKVISLSYAVPLHWRRYIRFFLRKSSRLVCFTGFLAQTIVRYWNSCLFAFKPFVLLRRQREREARIVERERRLGESLKEREGERKREREVCLHFRFHSFVPLRRCYKK